MGNEITFSCIDGGKTTAKTSTSNKPEDKTQKLINEELKKALQGNKSDKPVQMMPFMRTLTDEEVEKLKKDGKLDDTKGEKILKELKDKVFKDKNSDKQVHLIPHMRVLTDEEIKQRKEFDEFIKKHPKLSEDLDKFKKTFLEKK